MDRVRQFNRLKEKWPDDVIVEKLLYPVVATQILVKKPIPLELDLFEETVLRCIAANIVYTGQISSFIDLKREVTLVVLQQLMNRALIKRKADFWELTDAGLSLLNKRVEEAFSERDTVLGWVFFCGFTGKVFPTFHEGALPQAGPVKNELKLPFNDRFLNYVPEVREISYALKAYLKNYGSDWDEYSIEEPYVNYKSKETPKLGTEIESGTEAQIGNEIDIEPDTEFGGYDEMGSLEVSKALSGKFEPIIVPKDPERFYIPLEFAYYPELGIVCKGSEFMTAQPFDDSSRYSYGSYVRNIMELDIGTKDLFEQIEAQSNTELIFKNHDYLDYVASMFGNRGALFSLKHINIQIKRLYELLNNSEAEEVDVEIFGYTLNKLVEDVLNTHISRIRDMDRLGKTFSDKVYSDRMKQACDFFELVLPSERWLNGSNRYFKFSHSIHKKMATIVAGAFMESQHPLRSYLLSNREILIRMDKFSGIRNLYIGHSDMERHISDLSKADVEGVMDDYMNVYADMIDMIKYLV